MIDDPSYKAELIYGLDISELDPYSPQFQQTTDLICLCRLYDRFNGWLLPVEYNSLLRAIERQCEVVGVSFASLQLDPLDEGDWRDQLQQQRVCHPPRRESNVAEMDEVVARRIAAQKLFGTGQVLRRGPPVREGNVWRFAVRPKGTEDVPFDGREMTVMVRVGPEDQLT